LKRIIKLLYEVVVGWGIIVPLSYLVPKKNIVVLIPRFGNSFEGNLKYLFLYLNSLHLKDCGFMFLTENIELRDNIKAKGLSPLYYSGLYGIFTLLRAKAIIVDSNEWIGNFKYHCLFNSYKVQIWHGNGMKTIGMLKPHVQNRGLILRLAVKILGQHPHYDLLIMNSQMQADTRAKGFNYNQLLINGQPRNDLFFKPENVDISMGVDLSVFDRCKAFKENGKKIVIYSPTWREPENELNSLKAALDVSSLDIFAEKNNIIFIIKLHPKSVFKFNLLNIKNIVEYDRDKDIYPLLGLTDIMITDYSSIYIDYLLLDRPVVFFPFDYNRYVTGERALQFDYADVTPGKTCYNQSELESELIELIIKKNDGYIQQRKMMAEKFFKYIDGRSSERLWEYLNNTELFGRKR